MHLRAGRREWLSAKAIRELEPGLEQAGLSAGAVFFDARMHAARLVLETIFDAARHRALVRNHTECAGRER